MLIQPKYAPRKPDTKNTTVDSPAIAMVSILEK